MRVMLEGLRLRRPRPRDPTKFLDLPKIVSVIFLFGLLILLDIYFYEVNRRGNPRNIFSKDKIFQNFKSFSKFTLESLLISIK